MNECHSKVDLVWFMYVYIAGIRMHLVGVHVCKLLKVMYYYWNGMCVSLCLNALSNCQVNYVI